MINLYNSLICRSSIIMPRKVYSPNCTQRNLRKMSLLKFWKSSPEGNALPMEWTLTSFVITFIFWCKEIEFGFLTSRVIFMILKNKIGEKCLGNFVLFDHFSLVFVSEIRVVRHQNLSWNSTEWTFHVYRCHMWKCEAKINVNPLVKIWNEFLLKISLAFIDLTKQKRPFAIE